VVGPGTVIHVTEVQSGVQERLEILGAWDGDPDKNILSYLTPFAKVFVGQPVGAEVAFRSEGQSKKYHIDGIAAYVPAA
jgi:transcription elongation GreA/GreB family factor